MVHQKAEMHYFLLFFFVKVIHVFTVNSSTMLQIAMRVDIEEKALPIAVFATVIIYCSSDCFSYPGFLALNCCCGPLCANSSHTACLQCFAHGHVAPN